MSGPRSNRLFDADARVLRRFAARLLRAGQLRSLLFAIGGLFAGIITRFVVMGLFGVAA
jgi:hypothetical protein